MRTDAGTAGERNLALLCMMLAVLFWGLSFISTKLVLTKLPPVSIAFFRQVIALAVLVPWAASRGELRFPSSRDAGRLFAASLFGIVLYFAFENHGLRYTTASNASMLTSALPIFTLFSEALFFRQRVTWPMLLCLAASSAGVYLLVTVNGRPDFSSGRLLGNELIVGAMACWVVYTILSRKLAERMSSTAIVTFQSAASLPLFLPLLWQESGAWRALATLSAGQVANLIFLGVFCSAAAYFCYVYAVQRLGATVASAFLNLIPVVTVASGYLILQERLALTQLGGMGLVLASLYLLGRLTAKV